jgi:uncharacterized tellurite resistance protein B-like protein
MSAILVSSEATELLSRLTRRKLNDADVTPGMMFLSSLVTMTLGVMFADGTVTESETKLLTKTIEQLVPAKGDVPVLIQLLIDGIRENPIYQNPSEWLKLTKSLSQAERTLLLSFSYEMSAIDGEIAPSENEYLKASANALNIDPRYITTLESWYGSRYIQDNAIWNELQNFINPRQFDYLGLRFVSLDAVQFLSQLADKKLTKSDINSVVIFLSSLLVITWGVLVADGMQQEEEKILLSKTIKRLIPRNNNDIRELMELLLDRIPESDVYKSPKDWLKLTAFLSEAEKMLMISFCYEMSAIDGEISYDEKKYLHNAVSHLGIEAKYPAVLEAGFGGDGIEDEASFKDLQSLIHPDKFQGMDEIFVDAARYILDTLEVLSF